MLTEVLLRLQDKVFTLVMVDMVLMVDMVDMVDMVLMGIPDK